MNKRELDFLEKVYGYEIDAALGHRITDVACGRSKTASKLAAEGYIEEVTRIIGNVPPVCFTGYVLTHAGRLTYCMSDRCKEGEV